jgi:hypothetical protein
MMWRGTTNSTANPTSTAGANARTFVFRHGLSEDLTIVGKMEEDVIVFSNGGGT